MELDAIQLGLSIRGTSFLARAFTSRPAQMNRLTMAALDHARARGVTYHNYVAYVRNWIRRTMQRKGYEPHFPPSSTPSPRGKKPFESGAKLVPMRSQLDLMGVDRGD